MKQVNEDMRISAVDIFNIIASPTLSFLAQDTTELGRLILHYGIPRTTDDDAERGGEKSNLPVWKIDAVKATPGNSTAGTPNLKKRNLADLIATKLVGKIEAPRPKNVGTLNT